MQIKHYLIVGVMFYVLVAMSFPLLSAYAGTPRGPTQVTASYTSGSGQLAVSGTYFWDECKNKNEKHIVGFAIFIDDGHDSNKRVGNPKTNNAEALDGAGMHLANDGTPCKTKTGTFADDTHNASTNPILQFPPDKVCVVIYDVEENKTKDGHSQIGSGRHHNTENSFEKNGKHYTTASCTVPVTEGDSGPQCDPTLWAHVWSPSRLKIVDDCITVTGVVTSVDQITEDGDVHIWLHVDPEFAYLINENNIKYNGGNLVVEVICNQLPEDPVAKAACEGYENHIEIPALGTHVSITGSYVIDVAFQGHAEIHPITSIQETAAG